MKLTRTTAQREQVFSRINNVISTHKHLFKQGTTIPPEWLDEHMSAIVPQLAKGHPSHVHAMHRLSAYTKLNKLLAFRGLRLKSCNYGEYYLVQTLPETKKAVTTYTKVSRAKAKTSRLLDEGIARSHGKWRKLGTNQIKYLLTRI